MIFRAPWILSALAIFFVIFFAVRKKYGKPGFLFPSDELIKTFKTTLKLWLVRKIVYLRIASIVLICLAMARPQISREAEIKREGIAIIIAIDCSSTMVAGDLKMGLEDLAKKKTLDGSKYLRRIDAVREVAKDFVKSRPDDLIGIVAFAAEAFTVCPMTFNQEWLQQALDRVDVGLIKDGTAIGSGILSCLNSLKAAKAKSKVIILLTDGINNFGKIPPAIAAKAARTMGVKIYTIGVVRGSGLYEAEDGSGFQVYKHVKIDVDEKEMKKIAQLTEGQYFSATDMNSLRESYKEIDHLEKVSIEQKSYEEYVDIFQHFLFPALGLLLLCIVLGETFLKRIP